MSRLLCLRPSTLALAVTASAAAFAPAYALGTPETTTTATLTQRASVNHIQLTAGYGPARVDFIDGSMAPLGLQAAPDLRLSGSDSGDAQFSVYQVSFSATWEQQQDFSFQTVGNDAVLLASGSVGVSMSSSWFNTAAGLSGSPSTQYYQTSNWQSFEFVLDADTAFSFTGSAVAGQRLEMFEWSGTDWVRNAAVISPGSGESFSNSGQIDAGRYLLRNAPVTLFVGQAATSGNAWDYSLTLHNAVAAVPEPGTVATLLAGLGLMGWRMGWRTGGHSGGSSRRRLAI